MGKNALKRQFLRITVDEIRESDEIGGNREGKVKNIFKRLLLALCGASVLALQMSARVEAQQKPPQYKPPSRGAPASRVGGATRGPGDDRPMLAVLAPDHTGLTLREQPDLFWYVSKPVQTRLEITVINDQADQPVLEASVSLPKLPGLQRIRLSEHGVKLKPGVEYRWFVGLVVDSKQRSNDIVASGTIQYAGEAQSAAARLGKVSQGERYRILAEEGFWYDAIAALVDELDAHPGDATLLRDLRSLLQQVGVAETIQVGLAR